MQKGKLAQEAERLLDCIGWLPEPLRLAHNALSSDLPAGALETLPAYGEEWRQALRQFAH